MKFLSPAIRTAAPVDVATWLAAAVGVALLVAAAAAAWAGARQSVIIPAIGVPSNWIGVLLLPWVLLAVTGAAVVVIALRSSDAGTALAQFVKILTHARTANW